MAMKALIVDDCETLRRSVARSLKSSYEVSQAGDGIEGWQLIVAQNGDFDIVICDMQMPRCDGKDLYLLVQAKYPELARKFVFYTAGTVHYEWLATQPQPVIAKPFTPQDMRQAFSKVGVVETRAAM